MPVSLPLKLDFGPSSSPLAPGYTQFGTGVYTAARGYGWESASGLALVNTGYENPLLRDCVRGTSGVFLLDLPAGGYTATLTFIDSRERRDTVSVNGSTPTALEPSPPLYIGVDIVVQAAGQFELAITTAGPTSTDFFGLAALELVANTPPSPTHQLTAPTEALTGEPIPVSWSAPAGSSAKDWIGFYEIGRPNESGFLWWAYTEGSPSGQQNAVPFVGLEFPPGEYEFRYLLNDGYTLAAKSNKVTVRRAAEVTVQADGANIPDNTGVLDFGSVEPGQVVTKTVTVKNDGDRPLNLGAISLGE